MLANPLRLVPKTLPKSQVELAMMWWVAHCLTFALGCLTAGWLSNLPPIV